MKKIHIILVSLFVLIVGCGPGGTSPGLSHELTFEAVHAKYPNGVIFQEDPTSCTFWYVYDTVTQEMWDVRTGSGSRADVTTVYPFIHINSDLRIFNE
jgi:hypothetical protein